MPSEHAETIDVHRFRNRDPEAFEAVVRAYYDRVYRLALRLLCNAADAEDVVQEAFLKVHSSAPRFRGDSSLSTWVYRIAHNVCIDELRRRKRRPAQGGATVPSGDGPGRKTKVGPEEAASRRRAPEAAPGVGKFAARVSQRAHLAGGGDLITPDRPVLVSRRRSAPDSPRAPHACRRLQRSDDLSCRSVSHLLPLSMIELASQGGNPCATSHVVRRAPRSSRRSAAPGSS